MWMSKRAIWGWFGEGLVKGECAEILLRQRAAGRGVVRQEQWELLCLIFKICSLMEGQLQVFCIPGFQERENRELLSLHLQPSPGFYGGRLEDLGFSACYSRGILYSEESWGQVWGLTGSRAGEVAVSPCRNWLERHLVHIKRYERRDEEKVKVQAGIMAQFYNPQ